MAIEFATEVLGVELVPWQRWCLIHMLELAPPWTVSTMARRPKLEPLFRFRRIVLLVARQNGKSTLLQIVALFFMYALGSRLVLGTAQDLATAEEVWEGCVDLIDDTPVLAERLKRVSRTNGKKFVELASRERYMVKAANRRAARGLSGDLILLDELREHQSWEAWAAITKTATARAAAMIIGTSNAGDATSVVLRFLRLAAHEALGDPDGIVAEANRKALLPTVDEIAEFVGVEDDVADMSPDDLDQDPSTIGLFEYSAPPGCDVMDVDGLAQANPSAGFLIGWSTIMGDARTEGRSPETEWVFRTESMCQWPTAALVSVFESGAWDRTTNKVPQPIVSDVVACVVVSADRARTWIVFCGTRVDGLAQADVVATARGMGWVEEWLNERRDRIEAVTGQERGGGATSELITALRSSKTFKIPVIGWGGPHLTAWHGQTADALRDNKLFHNPHPILDAAAAGATKKNLAGGWVIDLFASPMDAAPLQGFIGAYGAWARPPVLPPPPPPEPQPLTADTSSGMGLSSAASLATVNF